MTEQQQDEVVVVPEIPVPLLDREIYVHMPKPEQLLVWQRTLDNLSNAPMGTGWTGSEVMAALERLRRIVDSIIVNKADVTWIDEQFLDGTLSFELLTPFLTQVAEGFAAAAGENAPNREAKRAVKKAARKKATT